MRIILVNTAPGGPTADILHAGVRAYNDGLSPTIDGDRHRILIDIETISDAGVLDRLTGLDSKSTLIVIPITEQELSMKVVTPVAQRVPCPSIRIAQAILQSNQSWQVALVTGSSTSPFNVLDSVAALLTGVSSIIDDRSFLIQADVLEAAIMHRPGELRRRRSMLLVGQISSSVQIAKAKIEKWESDELADPTLDMATWRAAMALAQIERLTPIINFREQPYSYVSLADTLNLCYGETDFKLSQSDLRRVIKTLAERWLGNAHQALERVMLPEYARKNGFPRNPPVIPGITYFRLSRWLYDALQELEISDNPYLDGIPVTIVSVPQKIFRRNSPSRSESNDESAIVNMPGLRR